MQALQSFVYCDCNDMQFITELLWKNLSSNLHVESAALLSWLHSLMLSSSTCEKVILEQFASEVSFEHYTLQYIT